MAADVDKIREIADRVAATHGVEVVEVDLRGGGKARMLRVYIDKPGGVFLRRSDLMPEADRILLHAVARVVIVADRGPLEEQRNDVVLEKVHELCRFNFVAVRLRKISRETSANRPAESR